MCSDQKLRPPNALFDHELDRIKGASRHNDLALAAALRLCVVERVAPPLWVLEGVDELVTDLLRRERSAKRGSYAGRVARYRQDMRDYTRHDAVEEVRRKRQEFQEKADEMAGYSAERRKYFGCIDKILKWFRYGTFQCASLYLLGTDAFASPSAIRASYRRVARRMRSKDEALRYYLFWGDFLKRLGVPWPGTYDTGTKFTPFYDLKP